MSGTIRPVILAGGGGTRLWPLSTPSRPKHLLALAGERTLLEQTLARVSGGGRFMDPMLVGSAAQADAIAALAPTAALLLEPAGRNSAPAIAAAALVADPEDLLLVLPSDHHIGDPAPFLRAVERGAELAAEGWIVTFGILPTRVETGYGYVVPGELLGGGAYRASRFVEKPEQSAAETLIAGGSFWNAGIFMMQAATALEAFGRFAPEVLTAVAAAVPPGARPLPGARIALDAEAFARSPSISFDHAVMESADRIALVPVDLDWSDLGTWASVYEQSPKDGSGNAADDRSRTVDSRNCLLRSEGPEIIAVGVEDLIVIATPSHVLVVPRSEAQRVREAAELASRDRSRVADQS